MRILLIHQYYLEEDDAGGSRFNEMTKQWKNLGHEVTVIAGMMHGHGFEKRPEYKGRYCVRKSQNGIRVWRTHVSESYNKNFLGRLWGYFSFVFSSIYAGIFKARAKYDLVLVTSPPLFLGITGYILSRWKRVPMIFEVRDLWPESAIDTGVVSNPLIIKLAYWLESFIYRKSALINVLTPAFRKTLIEEKDVPPHKVLFIPNAADFGLSDDLLESFDAAAFRKELGLENKFVVTYVGAHGVANHLVQLLDAAEKLRDTEVVFQLIGDGMKKKELVADAENRGLDNVIFREPVPKAEVFRYILASDMGASVLKKVDTFKTIYSNKTFDYMACKKPVLLAIDGVSRELIETADCGSFAEPENPEHIARVVQSYIGNQERLQKEGENGYHYAREHFDRSVLGQQYLDAMKSLL